MTKSTTPAPAAPVAPDTLLTPAGEPVEHVALYVVATTDFKSEIGAAALWLNIGERVNHDPLRGTTVHPSASVTRERHDASAAKSLPPVTTTSVPLGLQIGSNRVYGDMAALAAAGVAADEINALPTAAKRLAAYEQQDAADRTWTCSLEHEDENGTTWTVTLRAAWAISTLSRKIDGVKWTVSAKRGAADKGYADTPPVELPPVG